MDNKKWRNEHSINRIELFLKTLIGQVQKLIVINSNCLLIVAQKI